MIRIVALLFTALCVSGCGQAIKQIGSVADSTRSATEHAESRSLARNKEREDRIFAKAQVLGQDQAERDAFEMPQRARYEVRRRPDGWAIYDSQTGTLAKQGLKPQTGLSESQAYASFESLKRADEERSRALMTRRLAGVLHK